LDGAFALQDEIARSVVDALKIKLGVRVSTHEQASNGAYDLYLQRLFTDVTHPTGVSSIGVNVPLQNPSIPFAVPDYTSPGGFEPRRPDTQLIPAPSETGLATRERHRALEAGLQTNKITADVIAVPPETAFNTSVRDRALEAGLRTNKITADVTPARRETGFAAHEPHRASEAGLRTNKITADVTPAPGETGFASSEHNRASEAGLRTDKITADGPASIQGFVKDAKGEPIKGANIRIESQDGKQAFGTVKTDPKGRYISQGLQPGVYRTTLLVNGTVDHEHADQGESTD
jgi:hypothetical protein